MAKSIAIIGGGAAGFFTAINIAMKNSNYPITVFEASNKLLSNKSLKYKEMISIIKPV